MASKDKDDSPALDPNVAALIEAQTKQMQFLQTLVETTIMNSGEGGGGNALLMERLTQVLDKITGSQQTTAEIMERAQKQQARPSNTVAPMRSEFNLRGETLADYVRPLLICEMHIPHRAETESSTREEVELLNLLTEAPGQYLITRNDESRVKIAVVCEYNDSGDKVTKMTWKHDTAFRNEYFRTMPTMAKLIRQMLNQASEPIRKRADLILTMQQEKDLIEAKELTVSV